ncbi:MAG: helix-turn-helix domain-containing protein [FCB group bacterium]|nr:helix-turn-helix domain-containing protein [FCB group bacterium]
MSKEIINIDEACQLLQIKHRTMYQLLKNGDIPAVKIGGQWRFSRKVLLDLFFEQAKEFESNKKTE